MEGDQAFRKRIDALRRALRDVEGLLADSAGAVEALDSQPETARGVRRLDRLRGRFEDAAKAYLDQTSAFMDYVRERSRQIEESNRRAAMSERRSRPPRDEARIQELSQELSRELRLQRVDGAIKELLDFLSDEDFFAANASTARKRRLRTLQNAIATALQT